METQAIYFCWLYQTKNIHIYFYSISWQSIPLKCFTGHVLRARCNAQHKRVGRPRRLVSSRLCALFVWSQPERKQSFGWGLSGMPVGPDWTGSVLALLLATVTVSPGNSDQALGLHWCTALHCLTVGPEPHCLCQSGTFVMANRTNGLGILLLSSRRMCKKGSKCLFCSPG